MKRRKSSITLIKDLPHYTAVFRVQLKAEFIKSVIQYFVDTGCHGFMPLGVSAKDGLNHLPKS